MHKLGEIMTIVMTPLGALELNIPTIYGSKHQFRSYRGDVFDIPDWLGYLLLFTGLGVGGLAGYMVTVAMVNSKFWSKYVKGLGTEMFEDVTGIGAVKRGLKFLGSVDPVVKKKKK